MSLLALIFALLCSQQQTPIDTDTTHIMNPYDSRCLDTCVLLPLSVFRTTTIRVTERNFFAKEIDSRKKTDSLLHARIVIDSLQLNARTQQMTLCQDNAKDLRTISTQTKLLWGAGGVGAGVVATVAVGLLVFLSTR